MERQVGLEEARRSLGTLAESVRADGDAVVLSKRGRATAVLVGPEEYAQYKQVVNRKARAALAERLAKIRQAIEAAKLDVSVVDEAIAAARRL